MLVGHLAHLSEVLWTMGKTDEARALLSQALKIMPGNDTLKQTIERLNIDVNTLTAKN